MHSRFFFFAGVALVSGLVTLPANTQNFPGDMALSKILPNPDPGWEMVVGGLKFTDAACSDAGGNFYFCDLGAGTGINKITPDGQLSTVTKVVPKISGLKIAPDGRFIAADQGDPKRIVAIDPNTDAVEVLAEDIQPNDLVVSRKGFVYVTVTGAGEVVLIKGPGHSQVVAKGIKGPNGIALSPDEGTLAVSEYSGTNVWTYRVKSDGTLDAAEPYMTLRRVPGRADAGGDGSTVDEEGRYYVTSHAGIQMFDATGRISGVLLRPQSKATVSAAFAGDGLRYLYVCSSDKIYRRPTITHGVKAVK